jgi:hypothetical protein
MSRPTLLVASCAFVLAGCGARAPAAPSDVLPLRTLRLYETGVGYFERSGSVSHSSSMSLPVPAAHIDDALKTLVVLGPGGDARVQGVAFSSSVGRGMARALAGLPRGTDDTVSYRDLLTSLRGAEVEVRTAAETVRGRIVDVVMEKVLAPEKKADDKDAKAAPAEPQDDGLRVLLFADDGSLRRIRARDLRAVRPLDPGFRTRLDSALDALSPRSARAERALKVLAQSSGPVTLGYIAEAPVYRTTYRLVLGDAGKTGVLQGWALIHNDTDESWHGVHVDLVNGRPDSFLFPLAAPRYARRELVTPTGRLSTVPQLLDKTADGIWGDNDDEATGEGGMGLSGSGEGGGGSGYGMGFGSIGTIGHGSGTGGVESSSLLGVGNLASVAEATGTESGALFVYSLAQPLDLGAHASALLPFLQRTVDAREITLLRDSSAPARVAVRFVNNTPQTLPPGPISFFAHKGFAGESGLDRLKPGERRFIDYGADLDLELTDRDDVSFETPKHVAYAAPGAIVEHFLRTSDWTVVLENRSGRLKDVYVGLSLDPNATVSGADSLDYDMQKSRPMAVYHVGAKSKAQHKMHAVEGLERRLPLSSLSADRLAQIATGLEPAEAARLTAVEKRQKDLEAVRDRIAKAKDAVKQAETDLARLREDLKAAGGDAGHAAAPLVARVLRAEDKLAAQRQVVETLGAEEKTRADAVLAAAKLLGT